MNPTHDPCCSAHEVPMTCERYRRTHFVEVRPCCSIDAAVLRQTVTAPVAQAHADAGPTELAARDRIAPAVGKLRDRVLAAVVAAGDTGLTAVEVTQALGFPIEKLYSCAPRLPELVRDGYVMAGARRGDRMTYVATAAGRAWAEGEVAA